MIKGKYFHTYELNEETDRKEIAWQGLVMDYDPKKNLALVYLFSWLDGNSNGQQLKEVTDEWVFYETNEEMCEAYQYTAIALGLVRR